MCHFLYYTDNLRNFFVCYLHWGTLCSLIDTFVTFLHKGMNLFFLFEGNGTIYSLI